MQKISDKMGDAQFARINVVCEDCGEDIVISLERTSETEIKIEGGHIAERDDEFFFKCPECFEKNPSFSKNEVYSRVVGYLRPIGQWNEAKKTEHKMRKFYKVPA
jgi:anaerobic ribonucleoside-triphosphate reductase